MYVCICNAITEKQVREAATEGSTNLISLQKKLGLGAGCGSCVEMASEILAEYRQRPYAIFEPVHYQPKTT